LILTRNLKERLSEQVSGVALERRHVPRATSTRPAERPGGLRRDVTSGITCAVAGSRKHGVRASGEPSGCGRAERLEAVAAPCSPCWASCSSRIFHYQSFQYPTTAGTFRDRISWVGDVYRGDASISISSPTLKDNGTFSCAVKNPPDVHHNIPVTELTVTERGLGTMLSSVALLSILVFLPSAVVVALLLVRMGRKAAGLKRRSKSGYKKSSIEVSDDTDQEEADDCVTRLCVRCAECLDSDYEETY
uniref:Immunoglobulin V-set domain-containing protein n=1 Tax=Suricata suricatta TaxID=37032 RepID=A0A673VAD2_SURSU